MSVPNDIDAVARHNIRLSVLLFQRQKLLIPLVTQFEKGRVLEVRQRDLIGEAFLSMTGGHYVTGGEFRSELTEIIAN
jgi:hypothetical protein